ncbi:hypothetical protein ASF79_10795 [Agreia sp. Leaf335]|uniref:hypothetical protein n=1 Tax=Agreia sp. Leaf335 TaxID=1736340 RepID=UPI0006F3EBEB|nr:hypothetical protein [Agreia sp. Leaf335]KQR20081.1 hypothetical protein ASF79_10795 [Agreia sp. Leaf335]
MSVDDEASQAAVVSALAGFAGPQGVDGTVPRAFFEARRFSEQTGAVAETGFVGLPVGSADPGDGRRPPPAATPSDPSADGSAQPPLTVETPDEQAARLASDQLVVAQFLDAAGDAAGIRGPATTQTTSCEVNGVAMGQKVTGSVVIPVFEIAKTADDAYAAVTSAWTQAGLGSTETVMGRKYYSTSSTDAVVRRASIRGTEEGLSVMVEGRC